MNVNEKTTNANGKKCDLDRQDTNVTVNQSITNKIHITKHKGEILKLMLICFKDGGINGIKNGKMSELAEIIANTFSFDNKGSRGEKTTKKESILRELKLCEQRIKEENR